MKHFFPFLAILLLLCILLQTFPVRLVSAQQHNSFASAKYLTLDRSISITLPANASEYYYFLSLHSASPINKQYQITLSTTEFLSVSVYDDQGSAVNLKKTGTAESNWTGYFNNISDSERFFLVLHNQSKQDITLQFSVKSFCSPAVSVSPKTDSNSKKTATAKSGKKTSPPSTPKVAVTQKPRNTPKQTSCPTATTMPKPRNTSRQNSRSNTRNSAATVIPSLIPTPSVNSLPSSTKIPLPENKPDSQNTKGQVSDIFSNNQNNHTISRSNSILSEHFFRMSVGYSISAFELLSIYLSETELTLENLTPETISLQNNIIFAKSSGLAVLKIYYNDYTTSCTIYVQDTQ